MRTSHQMGGVDCRSDANESEGYDSDARDREEQLEDRSDQQFDLLNEIQPDPMDGWDELGLDNWLIYGDE